MMLKAVFADVMKKLLHFGNLDHACATEGVQGIISEASFANVAAHLACSVVSREAGEAHFVWLDQADNRAGGIFFAYRAGNDLLKIHFEGTEEVLGQIGAVETDRFVGIGSVVVVPVEQRGRRSGSQLQRMHS